MKCDNWKCHSHYEGECLNKYVLNCSGHFIQTSVAEGEAVEDGVGSNDWLGREATGQSLDAVAQSRPLGREAT